MALKTLYEDLGANYLGDTYANAWFRSGDKIHQFRGCVRSAILTSSFNINDPTLVLNEDRVDARSLPDFTSFKYPKLGYREIRSEVSNSICAKTVRHISMSRSASRGLRVELLRINPLQVYTLLDRQKDDEAGSYSNATHELLKEIFVPTFTPWSVGVKKLMDGEIPAFAINENLAISLSCTSSADATYEILFKERVVGTVSETGKPILNNKILHRDIAKAFT